MRDLKSGVGVAGVKCGVFFSFFFYDVHTGLANGQLCFGFLVDFFLFFIYYYYYYYYYYTVSRCRLYPSRPQTYFELRISEQGLFLRGSTYYAARDS